MLKKLQVILVTLMVFVFSLGVTAYAVSDEQAERNLQTYVATSMQSKEYSLDGGGSLQGKDLFTGNSSKGYDLDEKNFNRLSSEAQTQAVQDIALYSREAAESGSKAKGVDDSTVENWWKTLQSKKGVGSKFMNEILKQTKPDFVSANHIYQPFSGVVSTILGIGAVLIMSFLGLVMIADISYITLPPLRLAVDEKNGSSSKLFSNDAIYAVKQAEENDGGKDGSKKQALGIYFKRRVFMLILLGICLLYLVQGQIYTLVGYILDLVSGFLGF